MALIALKCPHCNGDFQIDDGTVFGFCTYCGTKILVSELVTEKQELVRKVAALLKVAAEAAEESKPKAYGYACEATDADPTCTEAWVARGMYAPNDEEREFALNSAKKLCHDEKTMGIIEKQARLVSVMVKWGPTPFNWGCRLTVDGENVPINGSMKNLMHLEKGEHIFVYTAPTLKLEKREEVEIYEETTVVLEATKSFFSKSIDFHTENGIR